MNKKKWILAFSTLILLGILIHAGTNGDKTLPTTSAALYTVSRGDLKISVTESGSIKALNSVDLASKVQGRATIVDIVPEGTIIRPEDVDELILVELDSSGAQQSVTQHELEYLNAKASYTEALESLDIQKNQNASDIRSAELKLRFALMDIYKYLGEDLAHEVITNYNENSDISGLIENERIGGEALQKLRELRSSISMNESQLSIASDKLEGTKRLFEKDYVSENELRGDALDVENLKIKNESAQTALALFRRYDFPKQVEQFLSDYQEAISELERTKTRARSKLTQSKAQLASREATLKLRTERFETAKQQLEACIIKAPRPGQVVYASSVNQHRHRDPIEIGREVHERQNIIFIPDTSQMKVELKIHETWIDRIKIGDPAKIEIASSSNSDLFLQGSVIRKAPLADPENWRNPADLKVYTTDILIEGEHDLRTGVTAKVEIIIDEFKDVLSIPIQAVVPYEGSRYCFVHSNGKIQRREVRVGAFNENFVHIVEGLNEGEQVLLNPPRFSQFKG